MKPIIVKALDPKRFVALAGLSRSLAAAIESVKFCKSGSGQFRRHDTMAVE